MKSTLTPSRKYPFRDLSGEHWVNLAMAGLITYYVAQVILNIAWGNLFGDLGVDFLSFWSAGFVANHHGFAGVYDLALMGSTERPLLPATAPTRFIFQVIPTPYLPLFIVPFQLLALMPPAVAAYGWIALNALGTAWYLWSFAKRAGMKKPRVRLLLLAALSAPAFLNLFTGQVNLLLMVCVGEFLLAAMSGRYFLAGVWLAGLLLKPQCLMLIVPALLIQRRLKMLGGLLAGSAAILGGSWLLAGMDALTALARLWLGYAGGLPTNDPQLMMNWRMIGFHLGSVAGAPLATAIVAAGMVITSIAALAVWVRAAATDVSRLAVAATTVFAGTSVVAWHSHVHMAMILLPPLLLLAHRNPDVLGNAFEGWVLLPALLYVLRILLASIMHVAGLGGSAYSVLDLLAGIGLFAMNLYLVGWGVFQFRSWQAAPIGRAEDPG